MKKQNGFTLIELVVVIVILGILAVTAAPKFLNLQDDARVSAVKGLAGAMKGAAGITYGKAAVQGQDALPEGAVSYAGQSFTTVYGYPEATEESLSAVVDGLDSGDWAVISGASVTTSSAASIVYGFEGFGCVAVYEEAIDAYTPAKVTVQRDSANTGSNNIENCQ